MFVVLEMHLRLNYYRYRTSNSIVRYSNNSKFRVLTYQKYISDQSNFLIFSIWFQIRGVWNAIQLPGIKKNLIPLGTLDKNKFGTVEFEFWTVRKPKWQRSTESFIKKLKIIRCTIYHMVHYTILYGILYWGMRSHANEACEPCFA